MRYENPWTFNDIPILERPEKTIGFIYCITDTTNNQRYIGKKQFQFHRRLKPSDKKRTTFESDWMDYYGSSLTLKLKVNDIGKEHFKREIIAFCHSKGELNFLEVMVQFKLNVLENDNFYNDAINKWKKKNVSNYKASLEAARHWIEKTKLTVKLN